MRKVVGERTCVSSSPRMRNVEVARAQEKLENVKEGEEIQRLRDLQLWEQSVEKQRQVQQKRNIMLAHLVRAL